MPQDRFGRTIDYPRLSIIDHCNLRRLYCMPLRGLSFEPGPELLTPVEYETVVRAAVRVGFRKFRLTGGEPTLRADLVEIVERIARIPGVDGLALTTNGILLPGLARPLARAGLRRLNIHVDTLDPERLRHLMRFASVAEIEAGIAAAESASLLPIKINCVVTRDHNDADVVDLARRVRERDWHVRFIELMPLGAGEPARISLSQFVPSQETRDRIEQAFGPIVPVPAEHPSDEARNYRFADGVGGLVGFISPVSEPCLLNDDELDVKGPLRSGGGEDAVAEVLLRAVAAKPTGHCLDEGVSTEDRSMFQLGG